jgi:hypothetical protein
MANIKELRTKPLADMSATELRGYIDTAENAGFSISKSKDLGKAVNLLKVLEPTKYGTKTVEAAKTSLQTQSSIPTLEKLGIAIPDWKQQQTAMPTATTGMAGISGAGDITNQLNTFQSGVFSQATSPSVREQISAQLEPQGIAKPEPLSRVALYNQMRQQYGVTGLENAVNDLKAQVETEVAVTRQRKQATEGQPVALGVIAGRVGEIERQQSERIDALNRQLNTYNDQLNTSYNMISTYMNYAGLDYTDAVNQYNNEFNRNLQIYNAVDEELDQQTAAARSNLQIYQNAIEKGNVSYAALPNDQKALITKLEVQSGLPAGFTAALKMTDAGGKVLSTTTREVGGQKYVDVVLQMPDGSMKVKSSSLGAVSGGGSEKVNTQQAASDMTDKLREYVGADKKVAPQIFRTQMQNWVAATGGTTEDFQKRFSGFVNTSYTVAKGANSNWWDDYGFPNPNK